MSNAKVEDYVLTTNVVDDIIKKENLSGEAGGSTVSSSNLGGISMDSANLDMQIKRDGAILWTLKTWYYALRYSREMNPYEVEAKTISGIS